MRELVHRVCSAPSTELVSGASSQPMKSSMCGLVWTTELCGVVWTTVWTNVATELARRLTTWRAPSPTLLATSPACRVDTARCRA